MTTLHVVYDGECPFCSSYVSLLRLREQYEVHLVDARKEPEFASRYGLDLNEGMIVDLDGEVHHGARAVSLLSRLSGTMSPLRSDRVASVIYPMLRFGRNLTLKVLGRRPI
ncbi:MAG TPA: DCC1-like thiol-disulfide oxidoreductase family protein [Steroidobacteraceae bacterium]|jgi:predicted DCC family thiol-disulfide oxidoreductase YuxK|nr:DCC1-like thiol-disulfide oxidoreductase family protein [Steroidobacteraceae bacterium]